MGPRDTADICGEATWHSHGCTWTPAAVSLSKNSQGMFLWEWGRMNGETRGFQFIHVQQAEGLHVCVVQSVGFRGT